MSAIAICPRCSSASLAPSRWADEESTCVACGYTTYTAYEPRRLGSAEPVDGRLTADAVSAARRAAGTAGAQARWASRIVPDEIRRALKERYAAGDVTLQDLADEYDIAVSTAQKYAIPDDGHKRRPLYNRRRGLEVDAPPDNAPPAPPPKKRGRKKGEHRRLAQPQIDAIRQRAAQGEFQNALAAEFGVSTGVIHNIVWRRGSYAYDDTDSSRYGA